jgi:3'(2'), 5'-bisphosphate nucleotidase
MRSQEKAATLIDFDGDDKGAIARALAEIALAAGPAVMEEYARAGEAREKADGSPVTAADERAEAIIVARLKALAPEIAVVAEEAAAAGADLVAPPRFFLVDPLDGTREFIAGRSEYTINIGLICEGAPILGVIAAPALGLIWRGIVGRGAERLEFSERETSPPKAIRAARSRPEQELRVMVSRSHLDAQTQAYLDGLRDAQSVPCGSSVKFCRLAEGAADLYPRFAPTRDWDVAAGHAILAAAGGGVVTPDGAALTYGSAPLRIPAFLAAGDPALLSVRR